MKKNYEVTVKFNFVFEDKGSPELNKQRAETLCEHIFIKDGDDWDKLGAHWDFVDVKDVSK